MRTGFSVNTVRDACELLYRVDRDLAVMQAAAGDPPSGLVVALGEELEAWLAGPQLPPRQCQDQLPSGRLSRQKQIKDRWSEQTRATYRQHIVRLYQWATTGRHPWMTYDPSTELIAPKVYEAVPEPATDAQVELIETTAADPHWLHLMLGAYQGFRPSDVAYAQRKHFATGTCEIDGVLVTMPTIMVRGKGNKPAILPCDPLIWKAVQDLPPGPIARRASGNQTRPITPQDITNDTAYYLHQRLHLDITMRSLRAWYATTMLDRYKNHRVVQELLRHSSLNTLQRYAAVGAARQRAAILSLPHFGGRDAAAADVPVAPHIPDLPANPATELPG